MITGDVIPPAVSAVSDHNLLTDLTVGQLIAVVATIGIIIGFFRKINPVMHRLNNLLDDWFGEPERPGVHARKGVMQRLSDQDEAIEKVRQQIAPLVDANTPGNHNEVLLKLAEIKTGQGSNEYRIRHIERLLMRHIRESKVWVGEVTRLAAEKDFETPPWPHLPDEDEQD